MPVLSHNYFRIAVLFLIAGICVGLYMSMNENYTLTGAHAHINLVGWVTSAIFGIYYALNPAKAATKLANAQFWIFIVGAVIMCISLFLLLAGNAALMPVVAISSFITFAGVLVFAYIVWQK